MLQADFSVHLGGGLYMNSRGELSRRSEPGKPVYDTPGGLPVNLDAFAKAFQGMSKALPDEHDPKSVEKFDRIFKGIGLDAESKENLIGILQGIGAVASVIGSVVPIVGAALAVLTLLIGAFKEGPSSLETLIQRRHEELKRILRFVEGQLQQTRLSDARIEIEHALRRISNYVTELKNSPPDEATLADRHQEVQGHINDASKAVEKLLETSVWLVSFNTNDHKQVWPWMAHRLYTFPSAGDPQRTTFPAEGQPYFDHRLMVPLVTFGVTSFLTLLRATVPEFRSTRLHREDLWKFARGLDVLITNMRKQGLARTLYTTADFKGGPGGGIPWGFGPEEVIDLSAFGQSPRLADGNTRFVVGALDLCQHNDAYFTPGFSASRFQNAAPQYAKQGLLNVRWRPPATLEHYDEPIPSLGWEPPNQQPRTQRRYRITNPEECARAANAQAEQDFSDLLFSSGYLNLVHLLATVRNEATDPDRSQTVRSEIRLQRKPGSTTGTVVESELTLRKRVISAPAEQQAQKYRATTSFTTQPLGRDTKLRYRVWLRTLPANFSFPSGTWITDVYGQYYEVGYADDAEQPGCKKLFTSSGQALGQQMIAEGRTDAHTPDVSDTVVLQASTYDYWIPVKSVGTIIKRVENLPWLRAMGWEVPAAPSPGGSGVASFAPVDRDVRDGLLSELYGWIDGAEPAKAQHRLPQQREIQVHYTMRWQADRLTITLENNRPEDRNYIIYVVVEETLTSGAVLHTFEGIPVTGQLTFVPQSFFDQEVAAMMDELRLILEFAERYTKSLGTIPRPRDPGDPDPRWLFGVDRERLAADPVMRMFDIAALSNQEELAKMADLALRHPPAAAVLREVLDEANISLDDLALDTTRHRPHSQ